MRRVSRRERKRLDQLHAQVVLQRFDRAQERDAGHRRIAAVDALADRIVVTLPSYQGDGRTARDEHIQKGILKGIGAPGESQLRIGADPAVPYPVEQRQVAPVQFPNHRRFGAAKRTARPRARILPCRRFAHSLRCACRNWKRRRGGGECPRYNQIAWP